MAVCPECGRALPDSALEGLCSRCLLDQGLRIVAGSPGAATSTQPAKVLREFGDYELIEEIARGGMGVVYRARQKSLDRIVAVKLLLLGPHANPDFVKRLRAEATVAAGLHHPNIVAIHEVGVHQGEHYLVMDFVDGPSLSEFVKGQPLPPRRAAQYLKCIAEAVHYAHERGVLHRDLKPSNVLIDSADQPRITDFGLAKRLEAESSLTASGQVIGSPSYMPPEQASATRHRVGRRSDVYSLGATLYHALTGRPPFVGEALSQTFHAVLHSEPILPRLLNTAVPRDLETICLKCLEKEPSRRYGTAREVADELARFLHEEPILARPVSTPEKLWRWCRRKPALAGALVLSLVLLLILGIGGPISALRIRSALRLAQANEREAEENVYIANVHQAFEALDSGEFMRTRDLLERIDASPLQRATRAWEWNHLVYRARGDQLSILDRHDSWVAAIVPSPNRRLLAMIGEDGIVKLWNTVSWEKKAEWRAHTKALTRFPDNYYHALAFTPDGATLITAGQDKSIRFWDAKSQKPTSAVTNLANSVIRLAVSRDGKLLAAGTSGKLSLWRMRGVNSPEPELLGELETSLVVLIGLDFSPDGMTLFAGGAVATPIQRYDIRDPANPRPLPPLAGSFPPFAISPDGQWLAAISSMGLSSFRIPDFTSGPTVSLNGEAATALGFAPEDGRLAVGMASGEIRLLDLFTTNAPVSLLGNQESVASMVFVHGRDELELISGGEDKTVRRWDASLEQKRRLILQHPGPVLALNFSPDSKYLATVSADPGTSTAEASREEFSLHLWNARTQTEVAPAVRLRREGPGGLTPHVGFSSDGKQLAADHFQWLQFYEVPSLRFLTRAGDRCAVFAPDGGWLAYIDGWNRVVKRSSLDSAPETLLSQRDGICRLAISPDGKVLTTSSFDGSISLWNAVNGRLLNTLTGHVERALSLAFSPADTILASAAWDGRLGIWDTKTGRGVFRRGHQGGMHCAAFSPDGRTIATCGNDRTVRLWNVAHREEIAILKSHTAAVGEVAFSPDGRWLASASDDGTVRLWHALLWAEIEPAEMSASGKK